MILRAVPILLVALGTPLAAQTPVGCPGEMPALPPAGYPGPADIVPEAPAPGAPATPATTGAAPAPATPGRPAPTPTQPGSSSPGRVMAPGTGFTMQAVDTSSWRHWWELNKEPYLGVRAAIRDIAVVTGSDDFFLGHGPTLGPKETFAVGDELFSEQVFAALVERLEQERDPGVTAAALLSLAEGGAGRERAPECARAIVPFLADGRRQVAETATVALGVLGHKDAVGILEAMVGCSTTRLRKEHDVDLGLHVPTRQRAFAAYALGLLGERADDYTRVRVVNTLTAVILRDGHRSSSHEVQAACVVAMGLIDLPLAPAGTTLPERPTVLTTRQTEVRWLIGLLEEVSIDDRIRGQVPVSLARLMEHTPEDFELKDLVVRRLATLVEARSGSRPSVRRGCALALGWIGDSDEDALDARIRAGLIEASRDAADQQTRHFALIALARAAGRPGSGAGDPVAGVAEARPVLARALANGSTPVRPWSALALAVLERSLDEHRRPSSDDTRAALRSALADARSPDEVGACSIAVGILRDPEAAELLMEKLDKVHDSEARGDVAVAVGMVGARGSIERLQSICVDSQFDAQLLRSVAIGLVLIGDKGVPAMLEEQYADTRSLSSQAALLGALARVGDARSVPLLTEVLADESRTSAARSYAAAALGRVSERDELPWTTRLSVGASYLAGVETLSSLPRGAGILDLVN